MHHLPHDRPRPDDRHLHDEVVEHGGLQARQRRHLRARLHLEHAHGIRLLEKPVHRRIVRRQGGQIDRILQDRHHFFRLRGPARVARDARAARRRASVDQFERILQDRHHAEAQQIHLHDAHVGAVVLVPLDDDAAGHGGGLERDAGVEPALADHHAARVLAEVARQILHLAPQPREQRHAIRLHVEADRRQLPRQGILRIDELEAVHHLGEPIDLRGVEAEHLPHLARRTAPAVGDDVGRHGRAEPSILFVHCTG